MNKIEVLSDSVKVFAKPYFTDSSAEIGFELSGEDYDSLSEYLRTCQYITIYLSKDANLIFRYSAAGPKILYETSYNTFMKKFYEAITEVYEKGEHVELSKDIFESFKKEFKLIVKNVLHKFANSSYEALDKTEKKINDQIDKLNIRLQQIQDDRTYIYKCLYTDHFNEITNRKNLKKFSLREGAFKELEIEKKEDLQWEAVKYLCRYEHCTSDEAEEIAQNLVDDFWLDRLIIGKYYDRSDLYFNNDKWLKNQFLNYCARNSGKAIEQYYQY